jgi:hypothetical protein
MLRVNIVTKHDTNLSSIYQKYLKEVEETENKKYKELYRKTRLQDLKKQAYLNYIPEYSKLRKMDLIKKIEIRITKETILHQDKNIFNKCLSYLNDFDIINFRNTCKTTILRVQKINKPKNDLKKYMDITKDNISFNMKYINIIYKLYPSNNIKLKTLGDENVMNITYITKSCLDSFKVCKKLRKKKEIIIIIMNFISKKTQYLLQHKTLIDIIIKKINENIKKAKKDKIFIIKMEHFKMLFESLKNINYETSLF